MLIRLVSKSSRQILFNIKPESCTLSVDEEEVYSFDAEGRMLTAWLENQTYVRTLDNRLIKKWHEIGLPESWKSICELEGQQKQELLEGICARMKGYNGELHLGELTLVEAPTPPDQALAIIAERLGEIAAWDPARYENEKARYLSAYSPMGILPPDQYYALVLQATVGCHWNRCTFCDFYRHASFHIRSEEEFKNHLKAVKHFLGRGIRLRHSIFLGDANALVIPHERLLRIFDVVNKEFTFCDGREPGSSRTGGMRGIYSFLDVFSGEKKTRRNFEQLKSKRLKRVYLGVETGCDELLKFLNKPSSAGQALEAITAIKEAGINVGVIVLVGVGGQRYFQEHVAETARLLNGARLGKGDLIFFSPLWERPDSEYSTRAKAAGIRKLTDEEQRTQLKAIKSSLRFQEEQAPKLALYDIREFVY